MLSDEERETIQKAAHAIAAQMPPWTEEQLAELAQIATEARARLASPAPQSRKRESGSPHPENSAPQPPGSIGLYRHYDQLGELLYVGISNDIEIRHRSHRTGSAWFDLADVRRRTVEWFTTREEALEAERAAIYEEKPLFNKNHNSDRSRAVRYLVEQERLDLLGLGW